MKTQESVNLIEGLLSEIDRVKEMIEEYTTLPKGAGKFGATMMSWDVDNARSAIAGMDAIQMIASLKKLREYEN